MSQQQFLHLLAGLRHDFLADLHDRCQLIESLLLQLEHEYDHLHFEELYREIHSLKGSGGTHGIGLITNICHLFEDYLSQAKQAQSFEPELVQAGLNMIDMLRSLGKLMLQANPEVQSIELQLQQLRLQLHAQTANILVVESSRSTCQILDQLLSPKGFRLVFCDDSLQALGRLIHEPFDLMLLAGACKPMNSNALLAALGQLDGPNRQLRVLVMSSKGNELGKWPNVRAIISRDQSLFEQLEQHIRLSLTPLV